MKTYLHIHHLDPGKEETKIISLLKNDGILSKYNLEGKTEDGNSIQVYIGDFNNGSIEKEIEGVLSALSDETLREIKKLDLNISLRLNIEGSCAYFRPALLSLAGQKGVQIYVSNWQNV
jgi:hypothetical protein